MNKPNFRALFSWWKVKRELKRIQGQFGRFISHCFSRAYDEVRYRLWDVRRPLVLKPIQGDVELKPNVAIFVVFQPDGCPESLFNSLRYLEKEGFSTLVISNLPLRDADRERLKSFAWKIAERPNLGHDFGAYRDGVWFLEKILARPQSLLFVNDSIWFPISDRSDLFAQLRDLDAPYLGLSEAYNFDVDGRNRPREAGQIHVTSFFFWLHEPVLDSMAFYNWWKNYVPVSRKRSVVRFGEVGFFLAMVRAGFSYDAIVRKRDLLAMVDELDLKGLIDLLARFSVVQKLHETEFVAIEAAIADGSATWDQVHHLVRDMVRVVNPSDLLAYEGIRRFDFPFLKKTVLKERRAHDHFLHMITVEPLAIDSQIISEVMALRNA